MAQEPIRLFADASPPSAETWRRNPQAKDYTGERYGKLVVVRRIGRVGRYTHWEARCDCGNAWRGQMQSLRAGLTTSCGCAHRASALKRLEAVNAVHRTCGSTTRLQLAGERFGRLLVKGIDHVTRTATYWRCRCDCGNEVVRKGAQLKFGRARMASCGCYELERASEMGKARAGVVLENRRADMRARFEGQTFNRLTIRRLEWHEKQFDAQAICDCSCGRCEVNLGRVHAIAAGKVRSCGCAAMGVSDGERELVDFLRTLAPDVEANVSLGSSRMRFDALLPSARIAVEFNGVYWHSAATRLERTYHLEKRRHAEREGFQLISVWQDDWELKRPRVEGLLRRRLGLGGVIRLGARALSLGALSYEEARDFHEDHHLQTGLPIAGRHFSLRARTGELMAAASFSGAQLIRYSVRTGYSVPGGLLRLLKASGLTSCVTYCDRDYFTGGVYAAAGFQLVRTSLQLSYAKRGVRYPRHGFMKHKLASLGYDPQDGETEQQTLERAGVHACYNSGIDTWRWNAPPTARSAR